MATLSHGQNLRILAEDPTSGLLKVKTERGEIGYIRADQASPGTPERRYESRAARGEVSPLPTDWEERGIQRFVKGQVSSDAWWCGKSWQEALGLPGGMGYAANLSYYRKHGFRELEVKPSQAPRGATVVITDWAWNKKLGRYDGHVGLSLGNGKFISNLNGKIQTATIPSDHVHILRR